MCQAAHRAIGFGSIRDFNPLLLTCIERVCQPFATDVDLRTCICNPRAFRARLSGLIVTLPYHSLAIPPKDMSIARGSSCGMWITPERGHCRSIPDCSSVRADRLISCVQNAIPRERRTFALPPIIVGCFLVQYATTPTKIRTRYTIRISKSSTRLVLHALLLSSSTKA